MEISFVREATGTHLANSVSREKSAPAATVQGHLDTVSGNIRAGLRSASADPEQLLEQTMESGMSENAISDAHDFNMARIMELLSDPLLKEDI
ncbi:hypothetical protein [Maridesulfovibrio sp. FT414]|uniref:hypothetical protein n=1 Tax=Maridesulfovibrio sp. FT414 TaxID=2979469 RepID=UPI003D8038C5